MLAQMVNATHVVSALAIGALLVLACSSSSTTTGNGGGGGAIDSGASGGGGDGGGTADGGGSADGGTTDNDSGSTGSDSGSGSDASTTPLVLTSTLLTNGAAWPAAYACGGANANVSPPLAWSGGPTAKSYAIVMVDAFFNIGKPRVHWIIYDMPTDASPLASGIPAGYTVATPAAHQSLGDFTGAQFLSPCPPMNGGAHTYEITVHALDVTALPGLTMASTATDTNTAVAAHTLASAKMSLTYSR